MIFRDLFKETKGILYFFNDSFKGLSTVMDICWKNYKIKVLFEIATMVFRFF
jgi:hypothetical protein